MGATISVDLRINRSIEIEKWVNQMQVISSDTIVIHPTNSQQLEVLVSMCKALNIKYEQHPPGHYKPEFVKKVMQGKNDIAEGRSTKVNRSTQLDNILGL
jgi:hypothetical protein